MPENLHIPRHAFSAYSARINIGTSVLSVIACSVLYGRVLRIVFNRKRTLVSYTLFRRD